MIVTVGLICVIQYPFGGWMNSCHHYTHVCQVCTFADIQTDFHFRPIGARKVVKRKQSAPESYRCYLISGVSWNLSLLFDVCHSSNPNSLLIFCIMGKGGGHFVNKIKVRNILLNFPVSLIMCGDIFFFFFFFFHFHFF